MGISTVAQKDNSAAHERATAAHGCTCCGARTSCCGARMYLLRRTNELLRRTDVPAAAHERAAAANGCTCCCARMYLLRRTDVPASLECGRCVAESNGITLNWKSPECVAKAVLHRASGDKETCQYPLAKSRVENHFLPANISRVSSMRGSG